MIALFGRNYAEPLLKIRTNHLPGSARHAYHLFS